MQVSNRLNNIRLDLLSEGMGIFSQSKVLFAMSIMGCSKQTMEETMRQIEGTFYEDCEKTLHDLSEKEFLYLQMEFQERYSPKQVFDGHVKACYTLSINAKTGGKAVGRREYDNTKYGLCASLKSK